MATPIRAGALDVAEAKDLVEALAVRGLIATAEGDDADWWVELNEPYEETERLLAEVTTALETWLADRGRETIEVHVGKRQLEVNAPQAKLDETLRSRLPASRPSDASPG